MGQPDYRLHSEQKGAQLHERFLTHYGACSLAISPKYLMNKLTKVFFSSFSKEKKIQCKMCVSECVCVCVCVCARARFLKKFGNYRIVRISVSQWSKKARGQICTPSPPTMVPTIWLHCPYTTEAVCVAISILRHLSFRQLARNSFNRLSLLLQFLQNYYNKDF